MNRSLVFTPARCMEMAEGGIRKTDYNNLIHVVFKYTDKDFAVIAGTSVRTLARLKPEQNIPFRAAEVTISLMRALKKGTEIFGSKENAVEWLKTPNKLLDDLSPVQALSSRFGAEEVMNILGRIQYGVYS